MSMFHLVKRSKKFAIIYNLKRELYQESMYGKHHKCYINLSKRIAIETNKINLITTDGRIE